MSKIATDETAKLTKDEGIAQLHEMDDELERLQELLYAASTHALLIVLQGMDTAGKDGTIRSIGRSFNPQGCRVESFKVPTSDELAHDFLWRVHRVTPARGQVTIFNRSHYEDVLAARVLGLAPEEIWQARYEQINAFEKLLVENHTIVVKFFLHISKDEQENRLLAREEEPEKAWKLAVGDWENRKLWDDYQAAYEDALHETSTEHASWHIVAGGKKWFRNLTVAQTLLATLRPLAAEWERVLAGQSEARREELKAYRS